SLRRNRLQSQRRLAYRALPLRALPITDMRVELLGKRLHHAKERHGSDLAKTAQGKVDDVLAGALDQWLDFRRRLTIAHFVDDLEQRLVSKATWRAFGTRLEAIELRQIAGK